MKYVILALTLALPHFAVCADVNINTATYPSKLTPKIPLKECSFLTKATDIRYYTLKRDLIILPQDEGKTGDIFVEARMDGKRWMLQNASKYYPEYSVLTWRQVGDGESPVPYNAAILSFALLNTVIIQQEAINLSALGAKLELDVGYGLRGDQESALVSYTQMKATGNVTQLIRPGSELAFYYPRGVEYICKEIQSFYFSQPPSIPLN